MAEAFAAREAFMSAASAFVLPIVEIDGVKIGDGRPGPVARAFRALYIDEARKTLTERPRPARAKIHPKIRRNRMQPMRRSLSVMTMTPMLYWIVYHLDLGRLGPKVLDLAVKRWLKRANEDAPTPWCAGGPLAR